MIDFHYEVPFKLDNKNYYADWLARVITSENASSRQIDYIFCSDEYLLELNSRFLGHDMFTDILTFDTSEGNVLAGDIYISVDRVRENASEMQLLFMEELRRVMVHGILHMLGYKDKTNMQQQDMRELERSKMMMFHVEQ